MRKVSLPAAFGMTSGRAKGRRRTSASVEPLESRRLFSTGPAAVQSDAQPTITLDDAQVVEGDEGERQIEFRFHLSEPNPDADVTFNARTSNGSAVAQPEGDDYRATNTRVVVPAGFPYTDLSLFVPVFGDTDIEDDEQFTLTLDDVEGATVVDGEAVGTILNDDPGPVEPPALSIDDVTRNEGDGGTTAFTFTVSRPDGGGTSSVRYATAYGFNTSARDMEAQSGAVTFAPGETAKSVTIYVQGDQNFETDNVFYVNLSDATNATIADGQGVGTILNDDAPPTLNINNVTRNEGDGGKTAFTFTVTRSSGTGTASVRYATAYGFNASKEDFAAQSGTVSFAAGQTSRTVTVYVNGDTKRETDNTFFVNLTNPVNAVIGDGQGLGTIRNDD